jgi:hypothetical protein
MRRIASAVSVVLVAIAAGLGGGATASAVPPDIDIAPTSLDFGVVNQGQTSSPRDVVVTNTGAGVIGPIAIDGAVAPGEAQAEVFALDDGCTGLVLEPGDSCALTYTFRPFFVRESVARLDVQVLELSGPDPMPVGATFPITLSGTGVNPIEVVPTVVDFGPVPVGTTSAPIGLRLHNPSDQPFGPIGLGGASQPPQLPFAADEEPCWGAVLPPGGSCEIPITFRPGSPGQVVAPASVAISATANRASVAFAYQLQGCGDSPAAPCTVAAPTSSTSTTATTTSVVDPTSTSMPETTTTGGPPDTVPGTSSLPIEASPTPGSPGPGARPSGTSLPRTGAPSPVPLVASGAILLAVGAVGVAAARRRRLAP